MVERQLGPDSRTVLYAVIGDPIVQSKSPAMMNRAFRETGINAAYVAFHVRPEHLAGAIVGMRAFGMGGMNVTIPHKQAVLSLLDEVDESAAAIGAVNTIVNRNGRLVGYNTDGIGYVRSLQEETGFDPAGRRIVVLGAGGGARGIVHALLRERPARVFVANRTAEKAERLARELGAFGPVEGGGLGDLKEQIAEADLLINTTSVGMAPLDHLSPVEADWLHPGLIVSDIVYNPMETVLLRLAKEKGCAVHGGLGMLIHQGACAFEYWTGTAAPVAAMREAALEAMGLGWSESGGSGTGASASDAGASGGSGTVR